MVDVRTRLTMQASLVTRARVSLPSTRWKKGAKYPSVTLPTSPFCALQTTQYACRGVKNAAFAVYAR